MQQKKTKRFNKAVNKHNKETSHWFNRHKKIIAFSLGALFIITILALIFVNIFSNDANKTVMSIETNSPVAAQFTDNNITIFSSYDNLPDVNNNRILSPIEDLVISYNWESGPYQPAFKMNISDTDLNENIKISPFIKGKWKTRGESQIVFTPETDWPADKKFSIKINENIINPEIYVKSNKISFTTPKIISKLESFNTYSAENKKVVGIAILSFNYPIDTKNFNDKVSLKLDDEQVDFTVKFDRFRMTAFITSAPIQITDKAQILRLKVNKIPALSGNSSTEKITAHTTIESAENIFKVADIQTTIADDKDGNTEQLLLLNMTAPAAQNTNWDEYIKIYLLPKQLNETDEEISHQWALDEITPDIISASKKVLFKQIDFANPAGVYQYAFVYDVSEKSDRYIYVSISKGALSESGFLLQNTNEKIMQVPYPKPEVKIAGDGALLSLAGDKKIGIMSKGNVDTAFINLYKVKSSEINHLISQTYNVFADNLSFKSWSFGVYDMSVVFKKRLSFVNSSMKSTNYASVDLGDYTDRTKNDKTGIFIIQTGASENEAEYSDKRLIILTNLGIIRKVNLDESSSIFVSNINDGTPAADIEVYVLGRNGNSIWAGRTDKDGRADIPKFAWSEYKNAREPVAIVVRNLNDISFIPYNAYSQQVEYSKFDVDGTYNFSGSALNAYIFSDRGIYRPGEDVIIGGIVKNKSFKSVSGIPVKIEIRNPQGRLVLEKSISLAADGMFDIKYEADPGVQVGNYNIYLYSLNSKNTPQDILGNASFRIEEFVPDTMKIKATINGATDDGWLSSNNLTANVSLNNLFGTPANNRKISAQATLTPMNFSFNKYAGYTFTPNFISNTGLSSNTMQRAQTFVQDIEDTETDATGKANIKIKFDKIIPSGTYMLSLNIKGYEAGSGKSVQTNLTTRVSDSKYLIGVRANSDLSYINRKSKREIQIIAIDHTATPIAVNDLTVKLIKRENLTSLIKDYNGYYKYQTVSRDKIITQEKINIPEQGTTLNLDTENGGTYFLEILDASEKVLANVNYFVAGQENDTLSSDTYADLQIKLNKDEFLPEQEIEVNITAPYTGTGLITIERDKVYAYKWFKTDNTSSIQKIKVPKGFEGTGYVNVSFVRDINSRDIFTTPYTYAVAPFSADISKRKIGIKLSAPETLESNDLTIKYETSQDARLMIFAVNEGILQVAKYKLPNPLGYFFQKAALQVNTYQILSLLLPEYKILKEFAKTGGGDYSDFESGINQILTNPFGRKNLPSVAFYSGIINTKANTAGEIKFDIPEYFSGSLKIYAVATNSNALGSANTETTVKYPLTISINNPLTVAPDDIFDINATISNMTKNSGDKANVSATAKVTNGIEITSNPTQQINVPENSDGLLTFSARATNKLGNANIEINSELKNQEKTLSTKSAVATLSVRPITTFTTNIKTGIIDSDKTDIKKFQIDMYSDFSSKTLVISPRASAFALPLYAYLSKYDYDCSEQIVSKAMPYVLMPQDDILGTTYEKSKEIVNKAINTLKNRQNDDGSFSLWGNSSESYQNTNDSDTAYLTAYVVDFLSIAKSNDFNVPKDMLSRGINFLRSYAGGTITTPDQANAAAFAIYVITSNGYVTTSYIDLFEEYAKQNLKDWEKSISGAYIATSYKLLKQNEKAEDLFAKYKIPKFKNFEYENTFNNNIANIATYYYLQNKYFSSTDITEIDAVQNYINTGNYSAYTSAKIIMALSGNENADTDSMSKISILGDDKSLTAQTKQGAIIVDIPPETKTITINCPDCNDDKILYYSVLQQGYPKTIKQQSNGIEIVREYYDNEGNRISKGNIGDVITTKIFARTLGNTDYLQNVVITDLLTGGFIPETITTSTDNATIETREDRILIYTDLNKSGIEIEYKVQLGSVGKFTVPPIQASSMYNPQMKAVGKTGTFTVLNEAN